MLKKINYFLNPPIIQFSPPRTGSTLLWNTLRVCLPKREVKKAHKLSAFEIRFRSAPIVASIRNPLDSISSSIQRYGKDPTDEVVMQQIEEYERLGMWDILEIQNKPNVKILKYEEFAFDFTFMFRELEDFFQQPIPQQLKQQVIDNYSIDKVKTKSDSRGEFTNFNKEDQIHGQHISKFSGASGYYMDFLSSKQIESIQKRLNQCFKRLTMPNHITRGIVDHIQ